jgi:hypothetical protein
VVGRADVLVDVEDPTEFLCESRGEPCVSVRDNTFGYSVVGEYMLSVEFSYSDSIDLFGAR